MSEQTRRKLSDIVIVSMFSALPPTIAASAALVVSLRNTETVEKVAEKVEVIHKATNSLTAQLVQTTRSDALQEGRTEGVNDEKTRAATKVKE